MRIFTREWEGIEPKNILTDLIFGIARILRIHGSGRRATIRVWSTLICYVVCEQNYNLPHRSYRRPDKTPVFPLPPVVYPNQPGDLCTESVAFHPARAGLLVIREFPQLVKF